VKRPAVLVVLVVATFGLGGAGSPAHAQTELTLDQYRTRLVAALAALRVDGDPEQGIRAAVDTLGLPIKVRLTDGSAVVVTSASLLGDAAEGEDAPAAATDVRLEAALDAVDAASSAAFPDRSRIDGALSQAYEGLQPVSPSWADRILSEVGQTLGWLVDHTLGAVARSDAHSLVGWTIVLAIVVGALLLTGRVRRGVVAEARWTSADHGVALVDWGRLAEEALAAGDLSTAVPALYHVLLRTLDARGVVRDAPALTAGECRRAVRRARPALAGTIDGATAAFERVAYGRLPAAQDDVEALRAADRAVRRS
jgi:hypothetical protein